MQDLFNELAYKCVMNCLQFEYLPITDSVFITDEKELELNGCLEDYPMDELRRMIKAVDKYVEIEQMEDEEFITEANIND